VVTYDLPIYAPAVSYLFLLHTNSAITQLGWPVYWLGGDGLCRSWTHDVGILCPVLSIWIPWTLNRRILEVV